MGLFSLANRATLCHLTTRRLACFLAATLLPTFVAFAKFLLACFSKASQFLIFYTYMRVSFWAFASSFYQWCRLLLFETSFLCAHCPDNSRTWEISLPCYFSVHVSKSCTWLPCRHSPTKISHTLGLPAPTLLNCIISLFIFNGLLLLQAITNLLTLLFPSL